MKTTQSKQHSGFTLIEIAVVLVIVGLLIGGIMKGQAMISSAKVKNLGQDLRNIGSFAYAYQDKFRALPGDDAAAIAHVSGTAATTGSTLGNGQIEGTWNSTTQTDESYLFWQHLRLAGIAPGSTTIGAPDYQPRNANGGPIGVTSTAPIAGWSGSLFACTSSIAGSVARQLDTTMDDGNTASGSVRVVESAGVSLTPANDNTNYTVCMAF